LSEKDIAKKIGADLIKNSGRGSIKGDMKWKNFIIDAKEGKSLQLNESVWGKICADTLTHGSDKDPMILRELPSGVKLAVIEFSVLKRLVSDCEELGMVLGTID